MKVHYMKCDDSPIETQHCLLLVSSNPGGGTHNQVRRQEILPHRSVLLVVFCPRGALMLGGEGLGASQSRGANPPLASLPFHYLQAKSRLLMLKLPQNTCVSQSQIGP